MFASRVFENFFGGEFRSGMSEDLLRELFNDRVWLLRWKFLRCFATDAFKYLKKKVYEAAKVYLEMFDISRYARYKCLCQVMEKFSLFFLRCWFFNYSQGQKVASPFLKVGFVIAYVYSPNYYCLPTLPAFCWNEWKKEIILIVFENTKIMPTILFLLCNPKF